MTHPNTSNRLTWENDVDVMRAVNVSLRARLTVAEDALRAICDPGCMVTHDEGDGSWIDTAIPGNIALKTLGQLAEMEASA